MSVEAITQRPSEFTRSAVNATVARLEELASGSDHPAIRARSVILLGRFGRMVQPHGDVPLPGIADRLVRIYASDDRVVRAVVVDEMIGQTDRVLAIEFLKRVARENRPEDSGDFWSIPEKAIQALEVMGPEGKLALMQLHATGEVTNPLAGGYLNYIAQHDFREPGTGPCDHPHAALLPECL